MNLRTLFSQLRPWMAFKMLCFTASSRVFNPCANAFYAISAEDQVIQTLLGKPKTGYYVDVGCYHPVRFSNTFGFYLRGWKGLTIDANCDYIDLHKKTRPKDTSVCCAVSASEETVVFTQFSESSISTISPEFVKEVGNTVPIVSEKKMKTRTLNSLLLEHQVPDEFDFLSIDVEGHDLEVLRGVELTKYRPRLIVIEMLRFSLKDVASNGICRHLEKSGYRLIAYYNINGFFLREDLVPSE